MSEFSLEDMAADSLATQLEEEAGRLKARFNLDTVEIHATAIDADKKTRMYMGGKGNYYARYGALRLHLLQAEEQNRRDCTPEEGPDL